MPIRPAIATSSHGSGHCSRSRFGIANSSKRWRDTLLHRFREGTARLVLLDQERRSPSCSPSPGRAGKHRLTMDIGSLGDLPIAAHGRADAFAVTLSAAGRELVFDPGTASYYGKPPRRGMDRGARAHPMEAPTRPEW